MESSSSNTVSTRKITTLPKPSTVTDPNRNPNGAAKVTSSSSSSSSVLTVSGKSNVKPTVLHLMGAVAPSIDLYPIADYTFGKKAPAAGKDQNYKAFMDRMRLNYSKFGMRRTVEGILLLQNHGFPHILLLQLGPNFFKLPGGRLRPGESELSGLKRILSKKLSLPREGEEKVEEEEEEWEIAELVATWWRPTFDSPLFPYIPPHVTKPKECKKLYIIQLDSKGKFAVPQNHQLVAVPLFELFSDDKRFGPILSTLPVSLARYNLNINR
eukprot:gb/GEZN01015714.1/.p1 GENE.gb/GEZN01015714.1/~~gb/GEZN01015714.1/.p1  ORF type:complete len:269 (-),score=23.62 gb/GEZN01015714.1/:18-824(-)